jgi:hypothetical protein
MHAYPLPAKEGMEDGGFEIEICPTNAFRFAIEETEDFDFFYQPKLTAEEIAEGAVRTENVVGSYAANRETKADHRVADTNYGHADGRFLAQSGRSIRVSTMSAFEGKWDVGQGSKSRQLLTLMRCC